MNCEFGSITVWMMIERQAETKQSNWAVSIQTKEEEDFAILLQYS